MYTLSLRREARTGSCLGSVWGREGTKNDLRGREERRWIIEGEEVKERWIRGEKVDQRIRRDEYGRMKVDAGGGCWLVCPAEGNNVLPISVKWLN